MKESEKNVTQKIVDVKQVQSKEEFASMLEKIAQRLKMDGHFILIDDHVEHIITPSNQLKVELSYEKKVDKHSFEIEFDWYEGVNDKGMFKIN